MPANPAPTHFKVTLERPFTLPDGRLTVPAGTSIVADWIVDLIPAELIAAKKAAEV